MRTLLPPLLLAVGLAVAAESRAAATCQALAAVPCDASAESACICDLAADRKALRATVRGLEMERAVLESEAAALRTDLGEQIKRTEQAVRQRERWKGAALAGTLGGVVGGVVVGAVVGLAVAL